MSRKIEFNEPAATRIEALGPRLQLRIDTAAGGGHAWALVSTTARKTQSLVELGDLGSALGISGAASRWRHQPAVEAALRALPSLANRPADYGSSREQLEVLRASGDAAAIVRLLPAGVRIGHAKASLSEQQREAAAELLGASKFGRALVCALAAEPSATKVLGLRLPLGLYRELEKQAALALLSPGQLVARWLTERLQQG